MMLQPKPDLSERGHASWPTPCPSWPTPCPSRPGAAWLGREREALGADNETVAQLSPGAA